MFFVNHRWLGGTLTNWATLQKSIKRLKTLKAMIEDGRMAQLSKKEAARLERELKHLNQNLEGVENMTALPDCMFVVDSHAEAIAVREARRMGVPVVGIVDTNCDPEQVNWVIPGNDDALRAIRLFTSKISDAVIEGRTAYEQTQIAEEKAAGAGAVDGEAVEYGRRYSRRHARSTACRTRGRGCSCGARKNTGIEELGPNMTTKPDAAPSQVNVPAQLVKDLRALTGAGFADCRSALAETSGDIEAAVNVLRKKGQAAAAKKAQRDATEGLVGHYIHAGGKIGVIVEINCESDFVARTEEFQKLCHDVAMHIAALDPRFVRREEVTPEILERENEIYREQAKATGKSEKILESIVKGKMEKFYEEPCLYEQHFIKDESVTIGEMVNQMIAKLGENISIRRFVRLKVGESAAQQK